MSTTIGILGGMGPLATIDFVEKIIRQTAAKRDQDHVPLLIHSVPQIPDRTACLSQGGPSPLPALTQGVMALVRGGVGCIAIPCNTAHYWHADLSRISPVPILHIARACCEQLVRKSASVTGLTVGLMATDGTLKAGIYSAEAERSGIRLVQHSDEIQQKVMEGIFKVKSGDITEGARLLEQCLDRILQTGVDYVILGCTEIPYALDCIGSSLRHHAIDATDALAYTCVNWYQNEVQHAA